MIRCFSSMLLLYFTLYQVVAQSPAPAGNTDYPTNYFRAPLDIPMLLSGNYGEMRSNHFHAGLDIKTQGVEGKKVYAAAEGYISRIKVSPFGYGKTLYIRHPNGYTTVYAHLQRFNKEITAYVKKAQYRKESFAIELFPEASQFPISKGELIALSGNTGGSLAPHLHFEIRTTANEVPVNPLLFGFDIKDDIAPVIKGLTIFPATPSTTVNGKSTKQVFDVKMVEDHYELVATAPIKVSGPVYFGLEVIDKMNGTGNRCGVYQVQLFKGKELCYHHVIDEISFSQKRYINAFVDYEAHTRRKKWVQKSTKLPNNKLQVYQSLVNNGEVLPKAQTIELLSYVVKDAYGNTSTLKWRIQLKETSLPESMADDAGSTTAFRYNVANSFEEGNLMLYLPPNILYEDLDFQFTLKDTMKNALVPTYGLHDYTVPLQSHMVVSIKAPEIPKVLRPQCLIVSKTKKKDKLYAEGGYWKGDYMVVKTRSFGDYTIMVDSVPPKIIPINMKEGENMGGKWSIMMKIGDNLSGIKKYRGTIDGKWVLMEYDAQNSRLTHYFEEGLTKGKHHFMLEVTDGRYNKTVYESDFIR